MTGMQRFDSQDLHRRARILRARLVWRLLRQALRRLRCLFWDRPSQRWFWQTIG